MRRRLVLTFGLLVLAGCRTAPWREAVPRDWSAVHALLAPPAGASPFVAELRVPPDRYLRLTGEIRACLRRATAPP